MMEIPKDNRWETFLGCWWHVLNNKLQNWGQSSIPGKGMNDQWEYSEDNDSTGTTQRERPRSRYLHKAQE